MANATEDGKQRYRSMCATSSMPTPADDSASDEAAAIAGDAQSRFVLGDVDRVGAVAPAPYVDAFVHRNAETVRRLVRRDDHRAGQSTSITEIKYLVYG